MPHKSTVNYDSLRIYISFKPMKTRTLDAKCFMSDKEFLVKLGGAIKRARKDKGWSQTELAYRIGMEKSNLSVIENGKSNPQILTIVKICSALGLSLDKLLEFDFDYVGFMEEKPQYIPRKHTK